MEETLILLRFNCPDSGCDYIGSGWGDMKLHVRATHGRMMWCVPLGYAELCVEPDGTTVTFVYDSRKYFPMNMPCIRQTSYLFISHRYRTDHQSQSLWNRSKVVSTRCVNSAANASSVTMSCTRTCGRDTKNVLYANDWR